MGEHLPAMPAAKTLRVVQVRHLIRPHRQLIQTSRVPEMQSGDSFDIWAQESYLPKMQLIAMLYVWSALG